MREPLKDRIRLEHILDSTSNIERFTSSKSFNDLLNDDMMSYAVVYNILVIGEAAYHLTKAFRIDHPETPWDVIMKMRNVLAHDYYKLKLQTVWEVIQNDLPLLKKQVSKYLSETDWEKWENNEIAVVETAVHKNLMQTARRMKKDGIDSIKISRYTGLTIDEIDSL